MFFSTFQRQVFKKIQPYSNYLTGETNLHFEILNSNLTRKIEIKSRHEIGYFTADHAGTEIKYKYIKERECFLFS